MATVKITKAQRYTDIKALLVEQAVSYGTTIEDALDFIDHEIELVTKKNGSKSDKVTDAQKQNMTYKELIVGFLGTCTEGVTCTEIGKGVPELNDFNNQKISSLVRGLVTDGRVVKDVVKGKSLFSLA